MDRAFARWCFTVEWDSPRRWAAAFSDPAARTAATTVDLYKRAKSEAGYNATYFLSMVSDMGGLETAWYLLHTSEPSDGYEALWERGRLDLTVEAAVLVPRWRGLFTDQELATARDRLLAYEFDVDAFLADVAGSNGSA